MQEVADELPTGTCLPAVEQKELHENVRLLLGFDDHMLGFVLLVDPVNVQLVGQIR